MNNTTGEYQALPGEIEMLTKKVRIIYIYIPGA